MLKVIEPNPHQFKVPRKKISSRAKDLAQMSMQKRFFFFFIKRHKVSKTNTFVVKRSFSNTDTDLMVYNRLSSSQWIVLQTGSEFTAYNATL